MSSDERHACPACGAPLASDAPEDLCAKCVIEVMMQFADDDFGEASEGLGEIGDYEIIEKIAAGGMGVVYRARQKGMGRLVALKLVAEGKLASNTDKERFLIEARAAGELDHPNIVPVYEVGEDGGQYFFSMRLVTGGSLVEWFEELGAADSPIPEASSRQFPGMRERQMATAKLLIKVARAVHFAHSQGILHRDLKPANILIDQHGEPQISDFGLAKRFQDDTQLTASGQLLGSPAYMAPEQAQGMNDTLSPAVDVYAIGVMLYQGLSGRIPFDGATPMAVIQESLTKEARPLRRINPRIDRDLETITHCCLEKGPTDRYQSAEALAEDLERWLDGRPITAQPAGPLRRLQKWTRRKPAIAALVTLTVIATAVISIMTWRHREERSAHSEEVYAQTIAQAQSLIAENQGVEAQSILAKIPSQDREFTWRWLWKRTPPFDAIRLSGSGDPLALAASSQSASPLYIQRANGQVMQWQPGKQALSAAQLGAPPAPENLTFHGGGRLLLSVRDDGTAHFAFPGDPFKEGRLPPTLMPPEGGFLAAAPGERPQRFIVTQGRAGDDVLTWSPPWRDAQIRFQLSDDLLAVALSPQSQQEKRHYVAFCYRTKLELWQWESDDVFYRENAVLRTPSPKARIAFSPNGRLIAESDLTNRIRVRNRKAPSLDVVVERQLDAPIRDLTIFDDNGIHRVATALADGEIRAWDVFASLAAKPPPPPLPGLALPIGLALDGSAVVGSEDGALVVWRFGEDALDSSPLGFPPEAHTVFDLTLLDSAPPKVVALCRDSADKVQAHAVTPEGWTQLPLPAPEAQRWAHQQLLGPRWCGLRQDGTAILIELESGKTTAVDLGSSWPLEKTRIFGSDPALFCRMDDNVLRWRTENQRSTQSVSLSSASPIRDYALSPDALTVAATHTDGHLRLWHARTGKLLLELDNHPWDMLAFSPDGSSFVAHETTSNLHYWDARPLSPKAP